jgi:hypothetical protein
MEIPFCVGLLFGRAGCLNTKNAGFRPGQTGKRIAAYVLPLCAVVATGSGAVYMYLFETHPRAMTWTGAIMLPVRGLRGGVHAALPE